MSKLFKLVHYLIYFMDQSHFHSNDFMLNSGKSKTFKISLK